MSMLDNEELIKFKRNFHFLLQKAYDHLISKEWAELIDRNVKIQIPIINENEVHFELIHTMINRLYETKVMKWEEINELP